MTQAVTILLARFAKLQSLERKDENDLYLQASNPWSCLHWSIKRHPILVPMFAPILQLTACFDIQLMPIARCIRPERRLTGLGKRLFTGATSRMSTNDIRDPAHCHSEHSVLECLLTIRIESDDSIAAPLLLNDFGFPL